MWPLVYSSTHSGWNQGDLSRPSSSICRKRCQMNVMMTPHNNWREFQVHSLESRATSEEVFWSRPPPVPSYISSASSETVSSQSQWCMRSSRGVGDTPLLISWSNNNSPFQSLELPSLLNTDDEHPSSSFNILLKMIVTAEKHFGFCEWAPTMKC